MNRISKNGNTLVVSFDYRPSILNVVREIDGRVFNAKKKQWEVPEESVVECVDALRPLNFIVNNDVLAIYESFKRRNEEVANIKKNESPYGGVLPLYDFQKTGTAFLRALPAALLADAPGLGKTLQTCAAFEDLNGQVLIFVPASLKFNWRDEIAKWLPTDKVMVIHGNKKERIEQWHHAHKNRAKWIIANYELLIHDKEIHDTAAHEWGAIVCDEADRIANPRAQTTRNLKALRAKRRVALTGTPVSNTPEDLWSIADWLYPRYLGTFTQFQKKYCKLNEWSRVVGYQNLDQLRERIEPIMLRRLKEDVLKDFPAKTVEHVRFELSKDERELYDAVRKTIIQEVKKMTKLDTRSLALIPVKMLRMKQATGHPCLIDAPLNSQSSKLDLLKEMLNPILKSGEKAIVFTQFSTMARIMSVQMIDMQPLVITGEVDALERKNIVDEFQANPNRQVLIMTEAGTYGLNLQAASYVFHYDAPWSVSKIEQREGRAHRIGQDKPVTVYHLIAKNTIDEYVLKVLKGKQRMADEILGDDEKEMTLSREDLAEILEEEV